MPRPALLFLLAAAGWALLALLAGPAHADTGRQPDAPPGAAHRPVDVVPPVASLVTTGIPAAAHRVTAGPTLPPAVEPVTGAAQALPAAVGHGRGTVVQLPAVPPASVPDVAGLPPVQPLTSVAPAVVPAGRAAGPAAAPRPSPEADPAPAAGPVRAASRAPAVAASGSRQHGRPVVTILPLSQSQAQPQPAAELGAPSVHGPLRAPTPPPLPVEPEAPTPPATGSCHAGDACGHAVSVQGAGTASPMLARARHVPDPDRADDELGAVSDPGSRPD